MAMLCRDLTTRSELNAAIVFGLNMTETQSFNFSVGALGIRMKLEWIAIIALMDLCRVLNILRSNNAG